uniref:Golgi phosphoprotein 3-like n=1 Tax=Meloidogyne hapla TaxID=6305 RepID=A0A1I8BQE9_MELHA
MSEGLVQRRRKIVEDIEQRQANENEHNNQPIDEDESADNDKIQRLTLMEEILLLGLKDREGYTSFWNDCISSGLRGCILIELALRSRIELEKAGVRKRGFSSRKETNQNESVVSWVEYLSGETWNPLKLRYQIRNMRERLAKNLVEKGVLTTEKQNFLLFDMTTHPLNDSGIKAKLIKKVQESVLSKWTNDVQRMDKKMLSLIILAHASDVLENAFSPLNDQDYELAMKRVRTLLETDYEAESVKKMGTPSANTTDVIYAVFEAFSK